MKCSSPQPHARMANSVPPKSEYVMYIFVNADLKMTTGKLASQVGHIVHVIVAECERESYESYPPTAKCIAYQKWNECCTKIVLKATEAELKQLLQREDARAFYDSGRTTQVPSDSLTVVGLLPGKPQNDLLDKYKLL